MRTGWGSRAPSMMWIVGAILLVSAFARPALAAAGDATDPREGANNLDIKRVYHSDDGGYVTYGVEMYNDFDVSNNFLTIQWDFDFNNDGTPGDACLRIEQSVREELRAVLHQDCGPDNFDTAEVARNGNTLEMKFPIKDMVGVGLVSDKDYGYRVTSTDLDSKTDIAPDNGLVIHRGARVDDARVQAIDNQRLQEIAAAEPQTVGTTTTNASGSSRKGTTGEDPASGPTVTSSSGADASPLTQLPGATAGSSSGFPTGILVVLALIAGVVVIASLSVERRRRAQAARFARPLDPSHAAFHPTPPAPPTEPPLGAYTYAPPTAQANPPDQWTNPEHSDPR